jgi:hypothetical protein
VPSLKRIQQEMEIRDLVARFADAVNRKATGDMYDLFTHDAVLEVPGFGSPAGIPAIVAFLDGLLVLWTGLVQAVHSGTITLHGSGAHPTAEGRWFLSELGVREGIDTYVSGAYTDKYVHAGGKFRFARRRFDLLYLRSGTNVTAYPFPT